MSGAQYRLPDAYLASMRQLLGNEYDEFVNIYSHPPERGLRFNSSKARPETIERLIAEWGLERVPWCADGYYYGADLRPGLSPYHDAGVYYIQEPSAMYTAEAACISPDEAVLDLCAAPGGKATQAAAKSAVTVANEPVASRARILSSNIERMGLANCIVTSAMPAELSALLGGIFDCVIVDAPCSGEGMMRREEKAIAEWSPDNIRRCALRQAGILDEAAALVRPGGRLVYSTCTFERCENEDQAAGFAEKHQDFSLCSMHRLMPHRIRGEGHFCAVFKKAGTPSGRKRAYSVRDFEKMLRKNRIHVLRSGIEPGTGGMDRKGKSYYTPSHAEAMAARFDSDTGTRLDIRSYELCMRYLRGESMDLKVLPEGSFELTGKAEGWATVYYDRYSVGSCKIVGGVLKNHYPRGLRR